EHGAPVDMEAYQNFLKEIGYLLPEGPDFSVSTANVDAEIATIAGPQLVVPVMNARYALNAANARWGSLYDALYGTDAIAETDGAERGKGYNPARGAKVIAWARDFLDASAPLATGRWSDVAALAVDGSTLSLTLTTGVRTTLRNTAQFAGYSGTAAAPSEIALTQNNLHIVIAVDAKTPIGQTDAAGISDIILESAITTIMDCEDSVAAVD
ncbi:malate synthase G, partial [Sinorhizobium sp. FG01]